MKKTITFAGIIVAGMIVCACGSNNSGKKIPGKYPETSQMESAPAPQPQKTTACSECGIWPYTSTRLVRESELWGMTKRDLRLMRCEIYARHGHKFKSADLREYFLSQPWYTPLHDEVPLTSIEKKNVSTIQSVENSL